MSETASSLAKPFCPKVGADRGVLQPCGTGFDELGSPLFNGGGAKRSNKGELWSRNANSLIIYRDLSP